MQAMIIHHEAVGCYHPVPSAPVAWTVHDTRGYLDPGPACDECGACECPTIRADAIDGCDVCAGDNATPDVKNAKVCTLGDHHECIGLSFAFVCLDGGESLCEICWEKQGGQVIPCSCTVAVIRDGLCIGWTAPQKEQP
jgi:hypothetical protein